MNWLVFALAAWVAIGLETGLKETLAVRPGGMTLAPSFLIPLAVYVAMSASPSAALWSCMALGLLMDLTAPVVSAGGAPLVVVGPYALGFFLAGHYVLAIRGLMLRRNPLSMVFLAITGSFAVHLVVVALFTVRELIGGTAGWQPSAELLERFGSSLYTGAAALVLSAVLLPLAPAFGFHPSGPSRSPLPRRAYERR